MQRGLGRQLKLHRKSFNLTVRELGGLMEVSYSLISRYENEERNPSLVFLHRFNYKLGLSPEKIKHLLNLRKKSRLSTYHVAGSEFVWSIEKKNPSTEINYMFEE